MRKSTLPVALAICLPLLFAFTNPIGQMHFSSSKKTTSMVIEKEIIIEKSIESAWQLLGPQFADAYKWASAVNHSEGKGASLNGSTCSERGCSTTMGALKEKLLIYSTDSHTISYEVAEGMPSMVKKATNNWQLVAISPNQTKLKMRMDFQLGGLSGAMMKPMMRMKMSKMGDQLAEEFKYYAETGQPHPRKVKVAQKYKAKA